MSDSQKILDLEHYLDGAARRSPERWRDRRPLEQWRAQGRWPESFDQFWAKLDAAPRESRMGRAR